MTERQLLDVNFQKANDLNASKVFTSENGAFLVQVFDAKSQTGEEKKRQPDRKCIRERDRKSRKRQNKQIKKMYGDDE